MYEYNDELQKLYQEYELHIAQKVWKEVWDAYSKRTFTEMMNLQREEDKRKVNANIDDAYKKLYDAVGVSFYPPEYEDYLRIREISQNIIKIYL